MMRLPCRHTLAVRERKGLPLFCADFAAERRKTSYMMYEKKGDRIPQQEQYMAAVNYFTTETKITDTTNTSTLYTKK